MITQTHPTAIKDARIAAGYSLRGLAAKMGVDHNSIIKWEHGDPISLYCANELSYVLCGMPALHADNAIVAYVPQKRRYISAK